MQPRWNTLRTKKRRAKYGAYGVCTEQHGGWWKGQGGGGRIDTRVAARDTAREQDALLYMYVIEVVCSSLGYPYTRAGR